MLSLQRGLDFSRFGGPSWEPKSMNKQSKNEAKMGRHLGFDFSSILADFGRQVGTENRAKIDQKRHRKNDGKKRGAKMAKKSQQEAPTTLDTRGPGPRGGGRGRGKPLPRGLKPEGLKRRGVENRHPTLDHPSPEGWWDSSNCLQTGRVQHNAPRLRVHFSLQAP